MTGVRRFERTATYIGVLAVGLSLVGAILIPDQFFRAWLLSYVFWWAIPLGALALLMLHHLVGGTWGLVSRRILESSARTLPLMTISFLPILIGMPALYTWANRQDLSQDASIQQKAFYLNPAFFSGRAVFYFACWLVLAWLLTRWSTEQDKTRDISIVSRFKRLSGPGLILYALTVTFASIDWVMSLEIHWFSSIYGMIFIVGQVLAALAFAIAVMELLSAAPPLSDYLKPETWNDFGNLLLTFIMLWAYLSFSQFLIIWAGNLPEEIQWYLRRTQGGWQWMVVVLALFHFAIPFCVLLVRRYKQQGRILLALAVLILVMRLADLIWTIAPASDVSFRLHWLDLTTLLGIGGLWLALFSRQLRKSPLLPVGDPENAADLPS